MPIIIGLAIRRLESLAQVYTSVTIKLGAVFEKLLRIGEAVY
jgi:hypothetical protein